MAKRITISIPSWLYEEIEHKRGNTNRSEYITQHIIKSTGGRE